MSRYRIHAISPMPDEREITEEEFLAREGEISLDSLPTDDELLAGLRKTGVSASWTAHYIRTLAYWRRRALEAEGAAQTDNDSQR